MTEDNEDSSLESQEEESNSLNNNFDSHIKDRISFSSSNGRINL